MHQTILHDQPLAHPWPGVDPFLFCAHHLDRYPQGNAGEGIDAARLGGRALGSDFSGQDGFSMYHGDDVPGFPAHPHRGFETVTIVPQGLVDHADSLGAAARYGDGDVQWLTTGRGVMHSEMFPLRDPAHDNPLDLYQIWLNLPARNKMAEPAFRMLWEHDVPRHRVASREGALAEVRIIAGAYAPQEPGAATLTPPAPPPQSWAADPRADVAIWLVTLEPGASLVLPAARGPDSRRTLYVHGGRRLQVDTHLVEGQRLLQVDPTLPLPLRNVGEDTVRILLLQGVPLREPVAAHGPFVMNTAEEIEQARRDFGRTGFGGWPWPQPGPVHRGEARFARHPGSEATERPPA